MKRVIIVTLMLFTMCSFLSACPSCYGAPDSPLTAGMNSAILVMLGITGFVLASIVGCFFFLWRRSKQQQAVLSEHLYVNNNGTLEDMNDHEGIPSVKRSH